MKRLLWLCTHRTQWREEIPLLLDAGLEVVPARFGHRAYPQDEKSDDPYYQQSWRQHCTLPADVVERIRAVNWFHDAPADMKQLVCEHFDGILVTSFVDTLVSIAEWFPRKIFYRIFGQAGLGTYTTEIGPGRLRALTESDAYRAGNYHWTPILPTLGYCENAELIRGEVVLEPYISAERLPVRWDPSRVEPFVAMVLSRATDVRFYQEVYQRVMRVFRAPGETSLPLRILGQNPVAGGSLDDAEIVGAIDDPEYYGMIARSSAFFYQGDSVCHLHWSALEALAMGVPVIMLQSGYLTMNLRQAVGPKAFGPDYGIAEGLVDARRLLQRCIGDAKFRKTIANRQRPLAERLCDRKAAAAEYRRLLNVA